MRLAEVGMIDKPPHYAGRIFQRIPPGDLRDDRGIRRDRSIPRDVESLGAQPHRHGR